ncbi:hypothetical protein AB1Y20_011689 [Prymnesium parvum]|uniref:lycopene beta-cyclase n=1 Tax=Prymnesium parvum TaxID=97485 RepID=A0AB34IJT6_PRYPA
MLALIALPDSFIQRGAPAGRASLSPRSARMTFSADDAVDVAVIGGGPAGYTMAALLGGTHGRSVMLVDPDPEAEWPNNYGSWRSEWEELSRRLGMPETLKCTKHEWEVTDCYFGGSFGTEWEKRLRLDVPYVQVDRHALKAALRRRIDEAGVTMAKATLQARRIAPNLFDANLVHDASGSLLTLSNGKSVRASVVVDATGFESKMVARETDAMAGLWKPLRPGYQIAYGFCCELEAGHDPYASQAMTLFDYRTDHFEEAAKAGGAEAAAWLKDAETRPSFMYVMPQGLSASGFQKAFFEETSLVGRDERRLEFAELKRRAELRLKHLGIKVRPGTIEEEEYCYIPMGGNLPDPSQRIVAIGGAAATVHPATGYQLCRMLASSTDVAAALSEELKKDKLDPDAAAAAAYRALWSPAQRLQRDFQVFGGEFLGAQQVKYLRGFFDAFFQLDQAVWGGFLAGWPGLPGNENHDRWDKRLKFGISLAVRFPPEVTVMLIAYAIRFSVEFGPSLLRSFVSPLFGEVVPYDARATRDAMSLIYVQGDEDAKNEARTMMKEMTSSPKQLNDAR